MERGGWLGAGLALGALALTIGCGHRADYGGVELTDAPLTRTLDREAQLRASAAAVAIVETDVGRGMAFVVDPRGYLITARHVIEDADHVEAITFPNRDPQHRYESVEIVYLDPVVDVALLHVHTTDPLPYLPVATEKVEPVSRYLAAADPIVLLEREDGSSGTAKGLAVRRGFVRKLRVFNPAAGPNAFVGVSNDVAQGQSGGPVLDREGRAVGIVTWTWKDRVGGFAVPIADATKMLSERPRLDTLASQRQRARSRTSTFVAALTRADLDGARRVTSPSHARRVREQALEEIFAGDEVSPALGAFISAVEELAGEVPETDEELRLQIDALNELVGRATDPEFREMTGLATEVSDGQLRSFLGELGRTYLFSRVFGEMDQPEALGAAMHRLRTVDAARTFAVADAAERLGPGRIEIGDISIVPGEYAPRAVVALRHTPPGRPMRQMSIHLRMEWGDWYVAEVTRKTLSDPLSEPAVAVAD